MRNYNKNHSLVRFLHAVPEGMEVDIYLNGSNFYKGLIFTEFTPYVYIPQGKYIVEIYEKDTKEKYLLREEIQMCSQELLTIAIIVEHDELKLLPIREDIEILYSNKSKARFIHLVVGGRNVNLILDGEDVFSNIKYTNITEYAPLTSKIYDLEIEAVDGNQIIRKVQIAIKQNRIYSFYALGKAPNFEIFQSVDGATFMN